MSRPQEPPIRLANSSSHALESYLASDAVASTASALRPRFLYPATAASISNLSYMRHTMKY